jgi:hypothetical protein
MDLGLVITNVLVQHEDALPPIDDAHNDNPNVCGQGCYVCAPLCKFICTEVNDRNGAKKNVVQRYMESAEGAEVWDLATKMAWRANRRRESAATIVEQHANGDMTLPGDLYRRQPNGSFVLIERAQQNAPATTAPGLLREHSGSATDLYEACRVQVEILYGKGSLPRVDSAHLNDPMTCDGCDVCKHLCNAVCERVNAETNVSKIQVRRFLEAHPHAWPMVVRTAGGTPPPPQAKVVQTIAQPMQQGQPQTRSSASTWLNTAPPPPGLAQQSTRLRDLHKWQ